MTTVADSERTKRGLEFGKALYELRAKTSQSRRNWLQVIEKLGIATPTAYRWINRYEESIGKHRGRPSSRLVQRTSNNFSAEFIDLKWMPNRGLSVIGMLRQLF